MIREKQLLIANSHRLTDILITILAFLLSALTSKLLNHENFNGYINSFQHVIAFLIVICWYSVFSWTAIYDYSNGESFFRIVSNTIQSVLLSSAVLFTSFYIFKIQNVSRFLIIVFIIYDIILLCLSKFIILRVNQKRSVNKDKRKHILIIGTKDRAKELILSIREKTPHTYKIIGCLDIQDNTEGLSVVDGCKVIGCINELERHLIDNVVDELVFAAPLRIIKDADKYIAMAEDMGVHVRIIPDWQLHYLMYEPDIATIKFKPIAGVPTMALHMTTPNEGALCFKTIFDIFSSAVLLLILSPLFLVVSSFIKLSSKGPVFFKQERLGLHGRKFFVYKFRTMVENAEDLKEKLKDKNEADGPVFKIKNDPRIIPYLGTLLRKTNLDELPQLINVLKGEMSLVGPRPPIPSEVTGYEIWQRRRLSMRPGITCLWQISPNRNDISFDDWMKLDLEYIDSWSLLLDLKILFMTVQTVLKVSGR